MMQKTLIIKKFEFPALFDGTGSPDGRKGCIFCMLHHSISVNADLLLCDQIAEPLLQGSTEHIYEELQYRMHSCLCALDEEWCIGSLH